MIKLNKKIVATPLSPGPILETQASLDQQLWEAVKSIASQKETALNTIKQLLEKGANPSQEFDGVKISNYFGSAWNSLWEELISVSDTSNDKQKKQTLLKTKTLLTDIFMHLSLHDTHENQSELYTQLKDLGDLTFGSETKAVVLSRAKTATLYIKQKDLAKACVTAFMTGKKIEAAIFSLEAKYINLRITNGATLLHLTSLIQDPDKRQKAVSHLLTLGANPAIRMNGGYTYTELLILKTPLEQRSPEVKWRYNEVPSPIFTNMLLKEWENDVIDTPKIVAFNQGEENLEIRQTPNRGESVFAKRSYNPGDIVCLFKGSFQRNMTREDPNVDYAFMLKKDLHLSPFRDENNAVCVSWAKINDGCPNVKTAVMGFDVFYIATQPIKPGDEIEWFYGFGHSLRRNPGTYVVSESSRTRFDNLIKTHRSIKSYLGHCHQQLQQTGTLTDQDRLTFQWILWSPLMDKQNTDLMYSAIEFLRVNKETLGHYAFFSPTVNHIYTSAGEDTFKTFVAWAERQNYFPFGR